MEFAGTLGKILNENARSPTSALNNNKKSDTVRNATTCVDSVYAYNLVYSRAERGLISYPINMNEINKRNAGCT